MGLTDINYPKLLKWLHPARIRQSRYVALLDVLTSQVSGVLYPAFKNEESRNWYDIINSSGQVARLELVLNDRFDPILKRLFIGAGIFPPRTYLYIEAEQQPLHIYTDAESSPVYLYTEDEYTYGIADFTVHIPYGLPYEENTMRAVIDRYKRDGKSYQIIYF